jgi:hypothetical protein
MGVINLFLTILYMLEVFALVIVIFILCLTVLPAAWGTIQKSRSFLRNNLITLAILFTLLTIVSDTYNWALGVYHRQTYLSWYSYITGGKTSPVMKTINYADDNKRWVLVMIAVFVLMSWYFGRQNGRWSILGGR